MKYFCPACKSLLVTNIHRLQCVNNSCIESYFIIDHSCPVLFVSSSPYLSVFDQSFKSPEINRYKYSSVISSLADFIHGKNIITHRNIASVLDRLSPNSKILIIGGGSVGHGCKYIYNKSKALSHSLYSLDVYPSAYVNVLADAHQLPFPTNFFDLVIIQAVLEHLLDPNQAVSEIYRVLAADGLVYSEVPFMQSVHEGAFDFSRFSLSGHKYLFHKFKILSAGVHHGPLEAILFLTSHVVGLLTTRYVRLFYYYVLIRLCRFFDRCFFRGRLAIDIACGTYIIGQKLPDFSPPPLSLDYIKSLYEGVQK